MDGTTCRASALAIRSSDDSSPAITSMLAHVYLAKGCIVPKHSHMNEQLTYILEGALHFWLGEARPKKSSYARARFFTFRRIFRTEALALEDTLDVDISIRRAKTG